MNRYHVWGALISIFVIIFIAYAALYCRDNFCMIKNQQQHVVIQQVRAPYVDNYACSNGSKDCEFNTEFFNDSYYPGDLDLDPNSRFNPDSGEWEKFN